MKLYSLGNGWQTLTPDDRTASVQAPGVSMPRLLLRRFKRRTAIAPTRYHAPLLSLFVPRHFGTRHNVAPPLGLCSSQWDSAFATMSSLSTSLLPLRSSLVRHATPCSGSCSCVASIILRRQIVPCSAYSAEQSSHDFSQRGLRLGDSFRI